jgi:hypothetical protein
MREKPFDKAGHHFRVHNVVLHKRPLRCDPTMFSCNLWTLSALGFPRRTISVRAIFVETFAALTNWSLSGTFKLKSALYVGLNTFCFRQLLHATSCRLEIVIKLGRWPRFDMAKGSWMIFAQGILQVPPKTEGYAYDRLSETGRKDHS